MKSKDIPAQVRRLVALATHTGTPPSEATAAAMKACRLIALYRLEIAVEGTPSAVEPDADRRRSDARTVAAEVEEYQRRQGQAQANTNRHAVKGAVVDVATGVLTELARDFLRKK